MTMTPTAQLNSAQDDESSVYPLDKRKILAALLEHQKLIRDHAGEPGVFATPEETEVVCPLEHHFGPGVYYRQIFMPAGMFIVGRTHKTSHLNVVIQGKAVVLHDGRLTLIEGPQVFLSDIAVKKVLLVLEDMIWGTIHPTEETQLKALEKELVFSPLEDEKILNKIIKEMTDDLGKYGDRCSDGVLNLSGQHGPGPSETSGRPGLVSTTTGDGPSRRSESKGPGRATKGDQR